MPYDSYITATSSSPMPRGCNPIKNVRQDAAVRPVGSEGPVLKAISPFGPEKCNPFMNGRRGNAETFERLPVLQHTAHQSSLDFAASIWHYCGCSFGSSQICSSKKYQNFRSGPNKQQLNCSSQLGPNDLTGAPYVELHELEEVTAHGSVLEDTPVKNCATFHRTRLNRHGLNPMPYSIVRAHSESIEPTLPDGCRILAIHDRCRRRKGHIVVVITSNDLAVKRAEKDATVAECWQTTAVHLIRLRLSGRVTLKPTVKSCEWRKRWSGSSSSKRNME